MSAYSVCACTRLVGELWIPTNISDLFSDVNMAAVVSAAYFFPLDGEPINQSFLYRIISAMNCTQVQCTGNCALLDRINEKKTSVSWFRGCWCHELQVKCETLKQKNTKYVVCFPAFGCMQNLCKSSAFNYWHSRVFQHEQRLWKPFIGEGACNIWISNTSISPPNMWG